MQTLKSRSMVINIASKAKFYPLPVLVSFVPAWTGTFLASTRVVRGPTYKHQISRGPLTLVPK